MSMTCASPQQRRRYCMLSSLFFQDIGRTPMNEREGHGWQPTDGRGREKIVPWLKLPGNHVGSFVLCAEHRGSAQPFDRGQQLMRMKFKYSFNAIERCVVTQYRAGLENL